MARVAAALGPKKRPELIPIAARTAILTNASTSTRSGVSDQPALRIASPRLGCTVQRQVIGAGLRAAAITADPQRIPATTAVGARYESGIDEPHALEAVEPQ